MNIATVDIETTRIETSILDIRKIFCIGVKVNDQPTKLYTYIYHPMAEGNLNAALLLINSCDLVVLHNGIGFDLPVLSNLLGDITIPVHDTLILSKLMYTKDQLLAIDMTIPDFPKTLYGRYSLKAFGIRMGIHKGDFEDFTSLTTEMLEYLDQDCVVTYALYQMLLANPAFPKPNVIELENQVAAIIFQQEINGFHFDLESARELNMKLLFEKQTIERSLQRTFKPLFLPDGPVKQTSKLIRRRQYIPNPSYQLVW